ncbi:nedd8-activating enzyme E1 catalytic subunit [Contarinia nasturtii]|uniref:nedd8-activating enzyme E1 catalytic subunit n=1 Tax=Contarinia nasturtii TaxID=265458 RepID=UPI0012D44870|nr:nedd8-activating enzyme E1 catalytic subunit [Contarinia nasturtii]
MDASPSSEPFGRRWMHVRKILERSGPFCQPEFSPSVNIFEFLMKTCKILVIGAGGLGCELLKDLALMGFCDIHVIDMDTIDLSNLNRQFLFRRNDIGSSKALCAAKFITERIPSCNVTPHFCKIQDYDQDFYRKFHIVVCGLDSLVARRWINGMVTSLLVYEDDGSIDQSSVIPIIDGGTEGFKGGARVILPGVTACIECTLELYPPQITYPLCTIANTPRLPEHCIEYVKLIQWEKESPFDSELDGDDPQHVSWVYEKAQERANQYNITGLSYRLVQGVLKHIIPAVASTNAIIAANCVTEVFKIATSCYQFYNNSLLFNDIDGIYTYIFESEKKEDCLNCSNIPMTVSFESADSITLERLIEFLCTDVAFQMRSPGITMNVDGKNKTLYISTVKSLEERLRPNLKLTLEELNVKNGQELTVTDQTNPNSVTIRIKYTNEV